MALVAHGDSERRCVHHVVDESTMTYDIMHSPTGNDWDSFMFPNLFKLNYFPKILPTPCPAETMH